MSEVVVACKGLKKSFHDARFSIDVLNGVNLAVRSGEQLAIAGASGSGKSTLLHLLGGLDTPTGGEVTVCGQMMNNLGEAARGYLRNEKLGFVYQFHHLLPEFSALENVAMPLYLRRIETAQAQSEAEDMLRRVGLGQRLLHKPAELSGGERQRAAIARALVTRPACVLADEPTGNLDRKNADAVYEQMLEMNRELGTSLIVVTHDESLASRIGQTCLLKDGGLHRST